MDVNIGDVISTVRAVDGNDLLAPQTMARIVQAVLQALRDQEEHHKRVRAEVRISGGVHDELQEEGR